MDLARAQQIEDATQTLQVTAENSKSFNAKKSRLVFYCRHIPSTADWDTEFKFIFALFSQHHGMKDAVPYEETFLRRFGIPLDQYNDAGKRNGVPGQRRTARQPGRTRKPKIPVAFEAFKPTFQRMRDIGKDPVQVQQYKDRPNAYILPTDPESLILYKMLQVVRETPVPTDPDDARKRDELVKYITMEQKKAAKMEEAKKKQPRKEGPGGEQEEGKQNDDLDDSDDILDDVDDDDDDDEDNLL